MTYTAKQREQYNHDRDISCERLDITVNQYNQFRLIGQKLHSIYEYQCNGFHSESEEKRYDELEKALNTKAIELAKKLNLFVFFQTDPRGATIYLSRNKIESNDYNRVGCECIY